MPRIIRGGTGIVLVVFTPASISRQLLARAARKHGAKRVIFEGPCLVCTPHNSRIESGLADIVGADNIAIAEQVSRHFSDVIGAIAETGIRIILPGEKFYIKVILAAKVSDYVERDVEFASTGMLVEKLAEISALPARNQHEADRVIVAVVGRKWAYVCAR